MNTPNASQLKDIITTVIENGRWEDTSDIYELQAECAFEAGERDLNWTDEEDGEVEAAYGPYIEQE